MSRQTTKVAEMSSLGIKIGAESFAAAARPQVGERVKVESIKRQAVLFWRSGQKAELRPVDAVGSSAAEVEITGFVDRVGDPVEVVASDGSPHRAEDLLAAAVSFLSRYMAGVFHEPPAEAVCYPSHWIPPAVDAFADSLCRAGLSGMRRVPESRAILARAHEMRDMPREGMLAVYDLGGHGLSITLAEAKTLEPVGQTVRYTDFGCAQVDYATLRHILDLTEDEIGTLDYDDPAVVRELAVLRDRCRLAKETLSTETATVIDVELGGFRDGVRLVRPELEELIRQPITLSADAVREVLESHNISARSLSGILLAGGGASIPLVAEFLSSEFGVPVRREPDPCLTSALGAMIAQPQCRATQTPKTEERPVAPPLPAPPQDPPQEELLPAASAIKKGTVPRPVAGPEKPVPPPPTQPPADVTRAKDEPTQPNRSRLNVIRVALLAAAAVLLAAVIGLVNLSEGSKQSVISTTTATTTTVMVMSSYPPSATTQPITDECAGSSSAECMGISELNCDETPDAQECLSEKCKADSAAPGCPNANPDCSVTPTAAGCPIKDTDCSVTPTAAGCPIKDTDCSATPTAAGCPIKDTDCSATPTAAGCPVTKSDPVVSKSDPDLSNTQASSDASEVSP